MSQSEIYRISERVEVCTSSEHTFGTDAFLLAGFAHPKSRELACDLGTGCGIIPLIWASRTDTDGVPSGLWGVELQPTGIELFSESLERSSFACPVEAVNADLRDWSGGKYAGQFHLVSCNPPYFAVGTGGLNESEAARLARHEETCSIGDVCQAAKRLLRYGGRLAVCLRPERLTDAMTAFRKCCIEPKRLRFVAKEAAAAPWLFLLEGKRGGKPGLQLLPQLNLYENGTPTAEFDAVYR